MKRFDFLSLLTLFSLWVTSTYSSTYYGLIHFEVKFYKRERERERERNYSKRRERLSCDVTFSSELFALN